MIDRAQLKNSFEFVTIAAARSRQLLRGALPRVQGHMKATTIAQHEVLSGAVDKVESDAASSEPE